MKASSQILLIDHDDSFTYNLRHWLFSISSEIQIVNHQDVPRFQNSKSFDLIVLSPGPKHPNDYPHIIRWLQEQPSDQPILGVCLGMQLMTVADHGHVESYTQPKHGKTSELEFVDSEFFHFSNQRVARYHSLQCFTSENFKIKAQSKEDKIPMWIEHKSKKWLGLQFHPESFLTEKTEALQNYLQNWIAR